MLASEESRRGYCRDSIGPYDPVRGRSWGETLPPKFRYFASAKAGREGRRYATAPTTRISTGNTSFDSARCISFGKNSLGQS